MTIARVVNQNIGVENFLNGLHIFTRGTASAFSASVFFGLSTQVLGTATVIAAVAEVTFRAILNRFQPDWQYNSTLKLISGTIYGTVTSVIATSYGIPILPILATIVFSEITSMILALAVFVLIVGEVEPAA